MHDVFISYSSKEITKAEQVRRVLEKNGISCWMAPADIPGGSNYTKEIPIAIRGCQVFVLMLSANAQSSHWVLKELDAAVNHGKVILPFMLEDCELNDEFNFLLSGAQRYSAYQRSADVLEKLVKRVKAIIGTDSPAPSSESGDDVVAKIEDDPPTAPVSGELCCPACGSRKLTALPKMKKSYDAVEMLFFALVPALCVVAPVVVFLLLAIVFAMIGMATDGAMYFTMVISAASIVLSVIFGKKYVRELIRRRRVRKHIKVSGARCGVCAKQFRAVVCADEAFSWEE